jgi:hypothetical protein
MTVRLFSVAEIFVERFHEAVVGRLGLRPALPVLLSLLSSVLKQRTHPRISQVKANDRRPTTEDHSWRTYETSF